LVDNGELRPSIYVRLRKQLEEEIDPRLSA
jgi:hypothetical protein